MVAKRKTKLIKQNKSLSLNQLLLVKSIIKKNVYIN